MAIEKKDIQRHFEQRLGRKPKWIVRAPGRVNLIGEHTDYNDGFVFPLAIDRAVWIALEPRDDRKVVVHSIDYKESGEFSSTALKNTKSGWIEYIKGTAWSLQDAGHRLCGWEGVLAGDVPLGAGLSSSAALEMATARAFAAASDLAWEPAPMALLGQRAENKWVGVNCGIMDQMISAAGKAGHALLIDCRDLKTELVPMPPGVAVVVLDTSTRRGLVDSAYNSAGAVRSGRQILQGKSPARREHGTISKGGRRFGSLDPPPGVARYRRKRTDREGRRGHAPRRRCQVGRIDEPKP